MFNSSQMKYASSFMSRNVLSARIFQCFCIQAIAAKSGPDQMWLLTHARYSYANVLLFCTVARQSAKNYVDRTFYFCFGADWKLTFTKDNCCRSRFWYPLAWSCLRLTCPIQSGQVQFVYLVHVDIVFVLLSVSDKLHEYVTFLKYLSWS